MMKGLKKYFMQFSEIKKVMYTQQQIMDVIKKVDAF